MPQAILPLFPANGTQINNVLAFQKKDGHVYYFHGALPIFSHPESDMSSFRLITSQLVVNGVCKQAEIVKAFGVSPISVKRYVKLYRQEGAKGFFKPRKKRSSPVLTPEILEEAQRLLNEGKSRADIAEALSIKKDTLSKSIQSGKLVEVKKKSISNETKSERNSEDSLAPMGMGCTRVMERVEAAIGELSEASTEFNYSLDVKNGGVLLALPALLLNGLLRHTDKYFQLPQGYYSLIHIFTLLALMALCRIKTIEQLRYTDPGEWGRLLGLDRIPEVRTLREKINALSEPENVSQWGHDLSQDWMEANPEAVGVLYVDGHVRPYYGNQTKLPRRYVSRDRLCLRGVTDYWVNDQIGNPFFVVSTAFNSGMLAMLRETIIPRLEKAIPSQPSQEELEQNALLSRFTMVFDREGYSPEFFLEMWKKRISCLTYHKYPTDPWPESEFEEYLVPMGLGYEVKMALSERGILLGKKIMVREIRKLTKSGHQTSVISTDYISDQTQIAGYMFSRWSQENFFKYMMQHFEIDRIIGYKMEGVDETKKVVNPVYRKLENQIKSKAAMLSRKKAKFGELALDEGLEEKDMQEYTNQKGLLMEEIQNLEEQLSELKQERKKTKKHVTLEELPEEDKFKELSPTRKQFIDTIKMISYRSETAMVSILREVLTRKDDARSLCREIYNTEADIIPDEEQKVLTIRLHHMANKMSDNAVRHLIEQLNENEIIYPGTDYRLKYKLVSD